ncbi:hypothetical protein ACFOYU_02135 [Microvirga sp. GCM10011540]|uniref:hypothetical protein n=1 Tax=Microvirga sp. GCM10011540 TaxID=3317338 RepID=UPI00360FEB89
MALGHLWAGSAFGTNTGNLFVRLEGEDAALTGTLHLNDRASGVVVYAIEGAFDGSVLFLSGVPQTHIEGFEFGRLTARAILNTKGELTGEWQTDIGSAGTFVLFPHDQAQSADVGSPERLPDQLHTARYSFGAIEIDREQIIAIADEIQRDFKKAQVVVTVASDTEQSRFLADFRNSTFRSNQASVIKLFIQEPEASGLNRVVTVEFGPHVNTVMTQGGDEAWVLGMLEKLKRSVSRFERTYATNIKKLGFGINQLLLVGAIVFLPSLGSLQDRAILMAAVLALIAAVNWLHSRYIPFAAIYLGTKPTGLLAHIAPTVVSWLISATAGIVATLLAAYLQGWLRPPS